MTRPETHVPDTLPAPFPIHGTSNIISGFGRGSSELGIPTANIPISIALHSLPTGIYYGWCKVIPNDKADISEHTRDDGQPIMFNNGTNLEKEELGIFPMVMSIGWNPFYHNKEKAAEVHIIHKFGDNFYGALIKYNVLGYIRPELNYTTKEALIDDINLDIKIALEALSKESYIKAQDTL